MLSSFITFLFLAFNPDLAWSNTQPDVKKVDPNQYIWLFESLISVEDRSTLPKEAFKSFRVHLDDTYEVFPEPSDLRAANLNFKDSVQGRITYLGFVAKKYRYDVLSTSDSTDVTLRVKVHIKNPQGQDLEILKPKLKQAEQIWNSNQVALDFNYQFQFELVSTASEAHFSVFLLDSTRGPYDVSWGRNWSAITVAHELGHMLGLGDEYQTLTSVSDCLPQSLMCESNKAAPMWHHYYFILRRLMK